MSDNGASQTRNLMQQFWSISKPLTGRDIKDGQVIMPKREVEDSILPRLPDYERNLVKTGAKSSIKVRDDDTLHECNLNLWLNGSSSYVLTNGWKEHFVRRRDLVIGEEVGFCWDERLNMLRFSVISRPPGN